MFRKTLVICLLIGASSVRGDADTDQSAAGATNNAKREAAPSDSYGPPPSDSYGPPPSSQHKEPAPVYGPPSSPQSYSKSIPAAAIRNVETVAVTKTITPVVTKTTTYNTHSEPALSIGHVQGYSQSAAGSPKIAPVQFQTQYTSYHNPTVGVNGPVTYTGPAVVLGGGYSIPLTGLTSFSTSAGPSLSLSSSSGGSPSAVYGPPSSDSSSSAPGSTYGPPSQSPGTPLGSYSMNLPQYVAFRPASGGSSPLSLLNIQQLQQLRAPAAPQRQSLAAMASAYSPVAIRAAPSSPYAIYQRRPISPVAYTAAASSQVGTALRYQLQRQPLAAASSPLYQRHHQPIAQPQTYVQTYAMPSVSFTRLEPVSSLNKNLYAQSNPQATIQRAISH